MSPAAARRGWCPDVRRPMATGDGLLVRLHPRSGVLSGAQARVIAEGAKEFGNGLLDISTRGNLQIRGVREETHDALVDHLAQAGLVAPEGETPRLTVVSPVAGLDPSDAVDAADLARRIEAAAGGIPGLPPKTAVVVDGGGAHPLDAAEADIALVGVEGVGGPAVAVGLATPEGPAWIGSTTPDDAPRVVARLLAASAALRDPASHDGRRVRDLPSSLWLRLMAAIPLAPSVAVPPRAAGRCAGPVTLGAGRVALLIALPFGRGDARGLETLAGWCESFGSGELRLSPWRGLAIAGVARAQAPALTRLAEEAGFIVDPADPRLAIAACPGLPSCASATTPTRRDAARLAEVARPLIASGATIHVSGCAKGCAQAKPASLTLVGDNGAYGVVLDGTSRDAPRERLAMDEVLRRLDGASGPGSLAAAFAGAAP